MSDEDMEDYQGQLDEGGYWPEGWYESNEHEETSWCVDETVTHWMPLPAPPLDELAGRVA